MNVRWIEAAWENFEEALSQRNWSLALAVAQDVKESYSSIEAEKMVGSLSVARSLVEDDEFASMNEREDLDWSDRVDSHVYNSY